MHSLIKNNILEKNLISPGENILIALSGGPDSVFLFHNLRRLRETLSFNLYASHINHMYRGKDAMHDEEFVRNLCDKYGIKLFVKRKNATEYAKELKVTEEEAGRVLIILLNTFLTQEKEENIIAFLNKIYDYNLLKDKIYLFKASKVVDNIILVEFFRKLFNDEELKKINDI
jgi:tRNA(Ile)-lysidine synthase TilS/MesJ